MIETRLPLTPGSEGGVASTRRVKFCSMHADCVWKIFGIQKQTTSGPRSCHEAEEIPNWVISRKLSVVGTIGTTSTCKADDIPMISPLLGSFHPLRLDSLIPRIMQPGKLGDQRGHHVSKQATAASPFRFHAWVCSGPVCSGKHMVDSSGYTPRLFSLPQQ